MDGFGHATPNSVSRSLHAYRPTLTLANLAQIDLLTDPVVLVIGSKSVLHHSGTSSARRQSVLFATCYQWCCVFALVLHSPPPSSLYMYVSFYTCVWTEVAFLSFFVFVLFFESKVSMLLQHGHICAVQIIIITVIITDFVDLTLSVILHTRSALKCVSTYDRI